MLHVWILSLYLYQQERKTTHAMKTKGAAVLEFVNNAIATGRTVYFTTMLKSVAVSPKAASKWAKAGNTLFKLNASGDLLMASGKAFVRITSGDTVMVKVSAE